MSGGKWILEIYQIGGGGDHVATMEFDALPSLRLALAENHGKKFSSRCQAA